MPPADHSGEETAQCGHIAQHGFVCYHLRILKEAGKEWIYERRIPLYGKDRKRRNYF